MWRTLEGSKFIQQCFLSASYDHKVRIHNLDKTSHAGFRQRTQTLVGHTKAALCLALHPVSGFLSGSYDNQLRRWDVKGTLLRTIEDKRGQGIYSIAFLSNDIVATGACHNQTESESPDHQIKLWNFSTNRIFRVWNAHFGGISALNLVAPERLVSASGDSRVRVWHTETQELLHDFRHHTDYVYGLARITDYSLVSGGKDKTIQLFDLETKTVRSFQDRSSFAHESSVYDLQTIDPKTFVSASRDGSAKIWDSRTPSVIRKYDVDDGFVYSATSSSDTNLIAVGTSGRQTTNTKSSAAGAKHTSGKIKSSGSLHIIDRRV